MTNHALVIGEALIDIVHRQDGTTQRLPGGSPMNVAIGLGRLGRDVQLATHIGTDDDGAAISAHVAASKVALVPGSTGAVRTSSASATIGADGSASYVFDVDWRLAATDLPPATVAHTGSIAAILAPGGAQVETAIAAQREHATITYDPNVRPALMGSPAEARERVERFVALADVVKASDEDLDWLYPGADAGAVAREWHAKGPAIVIVTRGGDGVTAVADAGMHSVPAGKASVVDTVGAGDSYMAGVIDGLWRAGLAGADRRAELRAISATALLDALTWAARIAAITVSRAGANPPWLDEL